VKFHLALARAAKDHVLHLTVQSFRGFFADALGKLLPTADMVEGAITAHSQLYRAIEAHDADRARELMANHLAYFEKKVKKLGERLSKR
jgi:GntR family transcriptional repressor for pyruvate dehydrogenase complex